MTWPGCMSYIGVAPPRYWGNPDANAFSRELWITSLTWGPRLAILGYFSHLLNFKISGCDPRPPPGISGSIRCTPPTMQEVSSGQGL